MLATVILGLHIIVAATLIAIILFFQQGKGAQIGSSFGGSSHTLFGSRGPATTMAKVTTAAAVIFMLTSITLSIISKRQMTQSIISDKDAPMTLPVSMPDDPGALPVTPPSAPASSPGPVPEGDMAPADVQPESTTYAPAPTGPVDLPQEEPQAPAGN